MFEFRKHVLVLLLLFAASQSQALELRTFLKTTYVTGGVGQDEVEAIHEVAEKFTLKILLAQGNKFFGDADVLILDSDNGLVLEGMTDGPLMFVDLPEGKYKVEAGAAGEHFTRHITIKPGKQLQLVFRWPE